MGRARDKDGGSTRAVTFRTGAALHEHWSWLANRLRTTPRCGSGFVSPFLVGLGMRVLRVRGVLGRNLHGLDKGECVSKLKSVDC